MKKTVYVWAVVALMTLLMASRIRDAVSTGGMDARTAFFTAIEAGFLVWGILVLRKTGVKKQ